MQLAALILTLAALAADPEGPVLTGTVEDEAGRPVAGAEVALAEVALPPGGQISRSAWRYPTSPPVILARGASDDAGGFRLPLAVWADDPAGRYRPRIVWACRPGASAACAFRTIRAYWPLDGEPVRLTLRPPKPVAVRVLGPDGRPVVDAPIAPARLRGVAIHPELGDRVAVRTDAAGRATLGAVAPVDLDQVRVTSGTYGVQVLRVPRAEGGNAERVVRLAPVGCVEGRVEADDPRAVRALAVHLRTAPDPAADEAGTGGIAEVATDDQGRFTVPAIAEGALALMFEPPRDLPFRGSYDERPPVEQGGTTRVTVALRRAVLVKGLVREAGTGTPIAGAGVEVWALLAAPLLARTDEQGRYAEYARPGPVRLFIGDVPPGYYRPTNRITTYQVPDGAAEFAAEPLELARGATLVGRVVGPDGRPAPGAEVSGSWLSPTQRGRLVLAITDRTGTFRIEGIAPRDEVRLSARRSGAITAVPVAARAGADAEAVTLAISPENTVALSARVVSPEGAPVAGAIVRLLSRDVGSGVLVAQGSPVTFDDAGRATLTTDPDGRFQTPRYLRPDLEYHAEVEAEGWAAARTWWINPASKPAFDDIVLVPVTPTRTVAGRVTDADGRPLGNVAVSQSGDGPKPTSAVTDDQGRFRVEGVVREPAFLFVAGPGLRFSGHRIAAEEGAVALVAPRAGDPPARTLHTLPPPLPRGQEKALALKLIAPETDKLTAKEATAETYALVDIVPRVDPARALELAERDALPEAPLNDRARLNAALGLIDESPEEAATVAETIHSPALRARFYRYASDAASAADRVRKVEVLDRALVEARAEPVPAARLNELGLIGAHLLDLGEIERGTAALREGRQVADTLPRSDGPGARLGAPIARRSFAAKLARVDAAAALEIVRALGARYDPESHFGVALALADRDPAAAEQALGLVIKSRGGERLVPRVAGRMAAADRARARRLADALEDPRLRARAVGEMARGLAATDPKAAAALVDEALTQLELLSRTGHGPPSGYGGAASIAVDLLPVAERLGDPALLEQSFWRTVALRPPRPAEGDPHGLYEEAIAQLAIGLSRYDRGVARQVLEPAARRARSLSNDPDARQAPSLFEAAAIIDPEWAAALVEALPADPPGAQAHPRALARLAVARVLAHGGARRWANADRLVDRWFDDRSGEP
jgi:hypothetical protein